MTPVVAVVSKIIDLSLVDGPGSRVAIFLQGCNLRCIACHNPHTMGQCTDCGACVGQCQHQALEMTSEGRVMHHAQRCVDCGRCVDGCGLDANPRVRRMTVQQVLERVRKVAPFVSGITVSGGEATLQSAFVRALFREMKAAPELSSLTRMVDSNGVTEAAVWEDLLGEMSFAAIDLKAYDAGLHRRITGQTNEKVLGSIGQLAQAGKLLEVRILLIAGVNDTDDEALGAGSFLAREAPGVPVRLMGFRRQGVRPAYQGLVAPSTENQQRYRELLQGCGLPHVELG